MNAPLVSIVIPVYNGANYLREAIESALAQTYANTEVVVVNDGSRDNGQTRAVARSYGDRIRYFEKPNGGVATALNHGVSQMRGQYFSWLSHDDLYRPDKIERQIQALAGKPAGTIAYCDFSIIDAAGQVQDPHKAVSPKGEQGMRAMLALGRECVHGCGLLIPATLFETVGRFDPAKRYTQDYDLWFRFAEHASFVHVAEPLVRSRQHEAQDSRVKAAGCTLEADRMHGRMLRTVSSAEIERFCGKSLELLVESQRIYANAGYVQTAAQLLRHLARLAGKPNNAAWSVVGDLVREQVLRIQTPADTAGAWEQLVPLVACEKDRPRILIYSSVWIRGGLERVMSIVMEQLKERYSVVLVSGRGEGESGYPLPADVTHLQLAARDMTQIAERVTTLAVLLDVDLVVGNPNISVGFLEIYRLLKELDIKSIACNHYQFFLPYSHPWLFPVIEKRMAALRDADVVTWPTHYSTNVYAQAASNAACMPNPCTFEPPAAAATLAGKTILCVGRWNDAVKRFDRVLEVFAAVLADHPEAELVVVGSYDLSLPVPGRPSQCYRELLQSLEIPAANIRFLGEQEHVEDFYASASVLLLTSESEGFGMVLTEAGSFGLPCALFDVPGLDDIISDGENGFRVPQGDVAELAAKVSSLLHDPTLRARMGTRARELVERFGRHEISQRFESLVETVLASSDSISLNRILRERFREPVRDVEQFTRLMIAEYERGANALLEANKTLAANTPSSILHPVVPRRKHWVKELAVVRYANTHLFKPYVKPALRKAGKPFRRAA
jgi:glycosyltransferase involved in cell wall biosynthesis